MPSRSRIIALLIQSVIALLSQEIDLLCHKERWVDLIGAVISAGVTNGGNSGGNDDAKFSRNVQGCFAIPNTPISARGAILFSDESTLGNKDAVVLTTGAEAQVSRNIVVYGDAKWGIDAYKDSSADAVSLQTGVGYRFN